VAWDDPQVSIGGLLDRQFWKQFFSFYIVLGKKPKYRKSAKKKKERQGARS
jgi:hypothetical protein